MKCEALRLSFKLKETWSEPGTFQPAPQNLPPGAIGKQPKTAQQDLGTRVITCPAVHALNRWIVPQWHPCSQRLRLWFPSLSRLIVHQELDRVQKLVHSILLLRSSMQSLPGIYKWSWLCIFPTAKLCHCASSAFPRTNATKSENWFW